MNLTAVQRARRSVGRKLRLAELRRTVRRLPHEKIAVLTSHDDLEGRLVRWFPDSTVQVLRVGRSADAASARKALRQDHHHVVIDDVSGPMTKRFAWMFHQVHDQGAYIALDNPKIAKHLRSLQQPVDCQTRQTDKDWFRTAATRGAIGAVETGRRVTVVTRMGTRFLADLVPFGTASDDRATVDLGIVYRIYSVQLTAARRGARARLEASNEGSRWLDVGTFDFDDTPTSTILFKRKLITRHLRVVWDGQGDVDQLEVFVMPRDCTMTATEKFVVSLRTDGLGERLNAAVAAIRLARYLGLAYTFTWLDFLVDDQDHAIATADSMFTDEFRRDHVDNDIDTSDLFRLRSGTYGLEEFDRLLLTRRGIDCGIAPLADLLSSSDFPHVRESYLPEFKQIGFAAEPQEAVTLGLTHPMPVGTAAIHLRGGDLTQGEYRKWARWHHKTIPLPVARSIVEVLVERERDVIVLGQEREVLADLAGVSSRVRSIEDIRPDSLTSRVAIGLFDLIIMARCDPLIAGTSGFARQAAALSGRPTVEPSTFFTPEKQYDILVHDLSSNRGRYSDLQTAFHWWSAFDLVRGSLDATQASAMLREASALDPSNGLYPITEAARFYRDGDVIAGNDVLARRLTDEWTELGKMPLLEHFPGRHGTNILLHEQVAAFAAIGEQSAMARLFLATDALARRDLPETDRLLTSCAGELESGLLADLGCDLRSEVFSSMPVQVAQWAKASHAEAIARAVNDWLAAS